MNKISNAIKCVNCANVLASPVLLPCGHTICRSHIDERRRTVACERCGERHSNCSFYTNEAISDMIAAQLDALDFGESHRQAVESCDQLDDAIAQCDTALRDPELYVYDMFAEFRRRADLRSEELKVKIDREWEIILEKLGQFEADFKEKLQSMRNSAAMKELLGMKFYAQQKLDEYWDSLNELKIDENKWRRIRNRCNSKVNYLKQYLIFLNELMLTSDFDLKSWNIDMFKNDDIDPFMELRVVRLDSAIIGFELKRDFLKMCKFASLNVELALLYRGSRDGFGARDFHAKCDNKSATLTIVKTTQDVVFGGYTEAEWNSRARGYLRDPFVFLFVFRRAENDVVRMDLASAFAFENYAVYNDPANGPVFGRMPEIFIADKCDSNMKSHSIFCGNFPRKQQQGASAMSIEEQYALLYTSPQENRHCQVAEIEVFQVY